MHLHTFNFRQYAQHRGNIPAETELSGNTERSLNINRTYGDRQEDQTLAGSMITIKLQY